MMADSLSLEENLETISLVDQLRASISDGKSLLSFKSTNKEITSV